MIPYRYGYSEIVGDNRSSQQSGDCPDSPLLHIDGYIMDKLCNHHKQDMDEIKRLEFLKGKRLADPYTGQPGRVDLLIGIKHPN